MKIVSSCTHAQVIPNLLFNGIKKKNMLYNKTHGEPELSNGKKDQKVP